MALKENSPGHINSIGLVDIIAKSINISTVRSQNISRIPPNIVGCSNLAIVPSKISVKNDRDMNMVETIINSNLKSKKPLRNMKKALMIPKVKPMIVRELAEIRPNKNFFTRFIKTFFNLDF